MDTKNSGFTSKLVHSGSVPDALGSAVTPIYQTSTFSFRDADHGARAECVQHQLGGGTRFHPGGPGHDFRTDRNVDDDV